MKTFVEELFAFLVNAGTSAGSNIFPNRLPQKVSLPAVRYFRVSNPLEYTHSGVSKLKNPRFQLECFASRYLEAYQLAEQVVGALSGYRGSMGSHNVEATFADDAGKDDHDPETGRHRVIVDVIIYHKEM